MLLVKFGVNKYIAYHSPLRMPTSHLEHFSKSPVEKNILRCVDFASIKPKIHWYKLCVSTIFKTLTENIGCSFNFFLFGLSSIYSQIFKVASTTPLTDLHHPWN